MNRLVLALAACLIGSGAWAQPSPTIGSYSQTTATGTTTARTLASRAGDFINVRDRGAKGDGIQFLSSYVTVLSGAPTNIKVNSATFTVDDVGKLIFVNGIGVAGAELATTITGFVDSQHVIVATAASTFVTAITEQVTYGTDDAAVLSTVISAVKAAAVPASIFFPQGMYIIKSASINATSVSNIDFYGYGATLYSATGGVGTFDGLGFYASSIRGITFQGDCALPPTTGLQIGRYNPTNQAFGLNNIIDLTFTGCYSITPYYNLASETTKQERISATTSTAGTYAGILDGINHFGLTSQYVSNVLPPDTPVTFTLDQCLSCRFVARSAGSNAVWMSAVNSYDFQNGYLNSNGYGIVVYSTSAIRSARIRFQGNIEGPPTDNIYIDGSGATSIEGLEFISSANLATHSVLKANPALTTIKMRDANVELNTLVSGSTFFDSVTPWVWTGDIGFTTPTTAPGLPSGYTGKLTTSDGSIAYYGFQSPNVPSNIPSSYGSGLALVNGALTATLPSNASLASVSAPGILSAITLTATGYYSIPAGGSVFPTISVTGPGTGAAAAVTLLQYNSFGAILAGATGFAVNNLVQPVGGSGTAPTLKITAVDANGAPTAMTLQTVGSYTSLPADVSSLAWVATTGSGVGLVTHGVTWKIPSSGLQITSAGSGYTSAIAVFGTPTGVILVASASSATFTTSSQLTVGTAGPTGSYSVSLGTFIDGSGVRVTLGATYTVPANTSLVRFIQTGTLAASTVTLPTAVADGQSIQFVSYSGVVTTLTFSPAVGGWTNGASLAANTGVRVRWDATSAAWFREQ